jgi:geranylgeranyl diphosphate synthase, type I
MEVVDILKKYSKSIDEEIKNSLISVDPDELQKSTLHLIEAGGKKIRPSLVVLSSEAVGGHAEEALKTAAAVELIHTFSLIHDDIMDKDDKRRGRPSVHVMWGEPMAILAGDTLFSKAFETVLQTEVDGVSYQRVIEALKTVVDSCIKICEGQASDMCFEGNFDVSEDEYTNMIYKKTGALISAATRSGAIIGGGSPVQVDTLTEYGRLIGLAFQIQDDYLDVISDEENLGKPVGSDIIEGKMTLMVVHALSNASNEDKEELVSILKADEDTNVARAMELFEKYGSIKYTHDIALEHVENAKKILETLEESEATLALAKIADYVLQRNK